MRKKSGVGNGEGSVGNGESSVGNGECGVDDQSGSFSVAHTGNAKIWKTHCPTRWDKTSHPLGQGISLFMWCRQNFNYTLHTPLHTPFIPLI